MRSAFASVATERLRLSAPIASDLAELHEIYADPALWLHFPSRRHTELQTTASLLDRWIAAWRRDRLGPWTVRRPADDEVLGHGGCTLVSGTFWNLGYRFRPSAHGRGYATEVAEEAIAAAHAARPDLPVVAFLLEHNTASARVAERVGLGLRHRGADAGNPDPTAVRLVYADRPLTGPELAAAMR